MALVSDERGTWVNRLVQRHFDRLNGAGSTKAYKSKNLHDRSAGFEDKAPYPPDQEATDEPLLGDWSFRPALWRRSVHDLAAPGQNHALIDGIRLHHDCLNSEIALRQEPGARGGFRVHLETRDFGGSYVSLSIPIVCKMTADHILRVDVSTNATFGGTGYLRLNRQVGKNGGRVVQSFDIPDQSQVFLEVSELPRLGGATWVDILFTPPPNSAVTIGDLNMTCLPKGIF